MKDDLARASVAIADRPEVMPMLEKVCAMTGMGFAAVARVTEDRWIVCQLLDRIEFGLQPGDELQIKTTICDEIRQSGQGVIIDNVGDSPEWRTHPVPILYGFKSYISLPIVTDDGRFFGTICAIDPHKRNISAPDTVAIIQDFAAELGRIFSADAAESTRSSL